MPLLGACVGVGTGVACAEPHTSDAIARLPATRVFGGGLKNGIEHLSNLLGSAFPSDFCLTCDLIGRSDGRVIKRTQLLL
jgi:hypothetical protein